MGTERSSYGKRRAGRSAGSAGRVERPSDRTQRKVLMGLGFASVGLGTIGIFVPGLPTTVFLLLASYFFARSSPRLHSWLVNHPQLGPYIRAAHDRAMPLRAAVVSLLMMWTAIGVSSAFMMRAAWHPLCPIGVVAFGLVGTWFIVRATDLRGVRRGVPTRPHNR